MSIIAKPSVVGNAKGVTYGQDGSGKTYSMDVKSEVNKNGAINPHSITSINEVPGGIIRKSGDQLRNAQAPRSGSSVSQNSENVNNSITKLADLSNDISSKVGNKAKKATKKPLTSQINTF